MSHTTSTGQSFIQRIINFVKKTPKQNSSTTTDKVRREQIKGTPFYIIEAQKQWFIVMGDYRMTETYISKKAALRQLKKSQYIIYMTMIAAIVEKMMKEKGVITSKIQGEKNKQANHEEERLPNGG